MIAITANVNPRKVLPTSPIKILAGDQLKIKNPNEEVDKEFLRVAVKNPGETFGLTPGETLPFNRFKIYLKQIPKNPKTFLFVKSELMK